MKELIVICTVLLLTAAAMRSQVDVGGKSAPVSEPTVQAALATNQSLQAFLGTPWFIPSQKLWKGRGGTSMVTAKDGTAIVFQSHTSNKIRRSVDGGKTWEPESEIGPGATSGEAVVDEISGDVLYVNPRAKWLWRSRDHGRTWTREDIVQVRPDGFGLAPSTISCMQPGITLMFGKHKGRLLIPARIMGPQAANDVEWRPYHYSTAIYSDDGGTNWQTSKPFPVLGTGEAALAELSDGSIL